jgi:hypothetical protein
MRRKGCMSLKETEECACTYKEDNTKDRQNATARGIAWANKGLHVEGCALCVVREEQEKGERSVKRLRARAK